MQSSIRQYFSNLSATTGTAWEAFWFAPTDVRPLCLLRIAVGAIAFVWAASYSSLLVDWFGPKGLIPKEMMEAMGFTEPFHASLLSMATSATELWILHIISLVVIACFTVGLMSRVASVLTLVVVISYVHRGPMITGHLEPVLTMLILYLCLAPVGAAYSLDRWLGLAKQDVLEGSICANLSARLIQVHLAAFYLMMGLNKLGGGGWWGGDAVWWLAARPESRLFPWSFLDGQEMLVNAWTLSIVVFELVFPLLIWNRWARPLLIAWSIVMWSSLALLTGSIGFCLTMIVANVAFVSPQLIADLSRSDSARLNEGDQLNDKPAQAELATSAD